MTNQEAIRILTDCIERGAPSARCTVAELEQAFEFAIDALQDIAKVRENIDAAKTPADMIYALYAATEPCSRPNGPVQNCKVADMAKAAYNPAKVRELLDALAECRPVYNVGDHDAVVEQNKRLLAAQGCAYYVQQSAVRAVRAVLRGVGCGEGGGVMFENEIELLSGLSLYSGAHQEALQKAIALMRAARARHPAAELEFVRREFAARWSGTEDVVDMIVRLRASARTETAAEVARLRGQVAELRASIDSAITALSVYEGQGGTAESVVADLRAALEASK